MFFFSQEGLTMSDARMTVLAPPPDCCVPTWLALRTDSSSFFEHSVNETSVIPSLSAQGFS